MAFGRRQHSLAISPRHVTPSSSSISVGIWLFGAVALVGFVDATTCQVTPDQDGAVYLNTTLSSPFFSGCATLRSISLPDGASVPAAAFRGSAVETVVFRGAAGDIGSHAFSNTANLVSVIIPGNTGAILQRAFDYSAIQELTFGGRVASFSGYSVAFCASLHTLRIAGHVSLLSQGAFHDLPALRNVNVPSSSFNAFTGDLGCSQYVAGQTYCNCVPCLSIPLPSSAPTTSTPSTASTASPTQTPSANPTEAPSVQLCSIVLSGRTDDNVNAETRVPIQTRFRVNGVFTAWLVFVSEALVRDSFVQNTYLLADVPDMVSLRMSTVTSDWWEFDRLRLNGQPIFTQNNVVLYGSPNRIVHNTPVTNAVRNSLRSTACGVLPNTTTQASSTQSLIPTSAPTGSPTQRPTHVPTHPPTSIPTRDPSRFLILTQTPSTLPSQQPLFSTSTPSPTQVSSTLSPSVSPFQPPSASPSISPTVSPTSPEAVVVNINEEEESSIALFVGIAIAVALMCCIMVMLFQRQKRKNNPHESSNMAINHAYLEPTPIEGQYTEIGAAPSVYNVPAPHHYDSPKAIHPNASNEYLEPTKVQANNGTEYLVPTSGQGDDEVEYAQWRTEPREQNLYSEIDERRRATVYERPDDGSDSYDQPAFMNTSVPVCSTAVQRNGKDLKAQSVVHDVPTQHSSTTTNVTYDVAVSEASSKYSLEAKSDVTYDVAA